MGKIFKKNVFMYICVRGYPLAVPLNNYIDFLK